MHGLNLGRLLRLFLLLFADLSGFHIVVPVSAKVLTSIDCGSSSPESYTDNASLVWVADNQYVQTGATRNVTTEDLPPGWDPHVMGTLREFKTPRKNCYSIDVDNKDEDGTTSVVRVLVRASFYYGNYDNKSNPPTFHLQFNGNNWTQVKTSMDEVVYHEVIYSLNNISRAIIVCLGQTRVDHFPFISALEVKSWDSDIYSSYSDPSYPLIFGARIAFGISTTVRSPKDGYGRIWTPFDLGFTTVKVRSNSTSLKLNVDDNPPEIVTRTSAVNLSSSANITMYGNSDVKFPIDINLYFSEVMVLNSTQKRSFYIIINGYTSIDETLQKYGPVSPPYGRALEVRIKNVVPLFLGGFKIDIVPTNDSTLPPLINALEDLYVGEKLVQGTNSDDVISLELLKKSFFQLQDWTGDPCLPSPYNWDWVACDSDTNSPRIIALFLNDHGLIGSLPDFSAMNALETIDFSNNSLTQEIPEFLGTLPKLNLLNLEGNNFSGEIPCSLLKNRNLRLSVTGNPNLFIDNNTSICKNNTASASISRTCVPVILGSIVFQMLVM